MMVWLMLLLGLSKTHLDNASLREENKYMLKTLLACMGLLLCFSLAQAQSYGACQPEVGAVRFGEGDFPGADLRIKTLFDADQAGREREVIGPLAKEGCNC